MTDVNRCTLIYTLFVLTALLPFTLFAEEDRQQVAEILTYDETPDGVVFELIGNGGGDYLRDGLAKIEAFKMQLRKQFPGIDIAVVSHGAEQFGLTTKNIDQNKGAHTSAKRLIDADIPVHICETHASWYDVTAEDFPDYISPTPQGPVQIRLYEELGYILVVID